MNEIKEQLKDEVVITAQKEQEKKLEFIGSIKPYKGHTLFKVNKETKEISKAEFKKEDLQINSLNNTTKNGGKKTVIVEEGYFYISALNEKNVIKKLEL